MKKLNGLLTVAGLCLALTIGVLTSCKKSTTKPKKTKTNLAVGYWYGSFINNLNFGGNEGALFRSDGTLKLYDFYLNTTTQTDTTKATLIGNGAYTVAGDSVKFNYSFGNEMFHAAGIVTSGSGGVTMEYTFTDPQSVGYSGTGNFTQQSK